MNLAEIIDKIDQLKSEIEAIRPLDPEQQARIMQKFRLDWNYHSNAIEGNTLTLGETRAFLLHGLTAKGKPFKDYLDIKGHNEAIAYLEAFVKGQEFLIETVIRELHKILLVEPYEIDAITPDGRITRRRVAIGQYKTMSNHVRTSTGEIHYYATPEETPAKMGELMQWYRAEAAKGELHPLILAATFHYRFVAIHPFDDGNGRMARLLTNLILMQAGFVPVIIRIEAKPAYLLALEEADAGDLGDFVSLIGEELINSMDLYLRGARGESIEELEDLDKKVALLQRQLQSQNKSTGIIKDAAVQANIVDELIHPFLAKLLDKLSKFEVFFNGAPTYWAMLMQSGQNVQRINFAQPDIFLGNLLRFLKSDVAVDQFSFSYRLGGFITNERFKISLGLRFFLKKQNFEIRYSLQTRKSEQLISKNYGESFSEEDVEKLAVIVATKIYDLIKQQTNSES